MTFSLLDYSTPRIIGFAFLLLLALLLTVMAIRNFVYSIRHPLVRVENPSVKRETTTTTYTKSIHSFSLPVLVPSAPLDIVEIMTIVAASPKS